MQHRVIQHSEWLLQGKQFIANILLLQIVCQFLPVLRQKLLHALFADATVAMHYCPIPEAQECWSVTDAQTHHQTSSLKTRLSDDRHEHYVIVLLRKSLVLYGESLARSARLRFAHQDDFAVSILLNQGCDLLL